MLLAARLHPCACVCASVCVCVCERSKCRATGPCMGPLCIKHKLRCLAAAEYERRVGARRAFEDRTGCDGATACRSLQVAPLFAAPALRPTPPVGRLLPFPVVAVLWLFSCLFRGSQLQRYNLGLEDLDSAIAAYQADAQPLDVCAEKLRVPLRLRACVCALVLVRDCVRVGVAASWLRACWCAFVCLCSHGTIGSIVARHRPRCRPLRASGPRRRAIGS